VQQLLCDLKPLFSADYLLPRTLLTIMSLEHLEEVFMSMAVPSDACLANAFFFVHTEYPSTEQVLKVK